nr:ATP-binding cassette domain-containing protein [Vallitaleaceae bacterium]
ELAVADAEEIERNDALINKLRAIATNNSDSAKGKSLKARVKVQERLEARKVDAPYVDIKQLDINLGSDDALATNDTEINNNANNDDTPINISADSNDASISITPETNETIALKVNNYSVSFDEVLLENVSFEIKSTDKVALIGSNGTGKTTLIRDIYKNNLASIEIAEDTTIADRSQLQGEILNENNTIQEEFIDAGFSTYAKIEAYMADYGFEGEILHQKIASLSGGEKNILQLAKVSASKANLLLLDEPTSHLDTYSQIALEKAIDNYKGAVIMISHDYYSIVNCMDYVLIIENKTVRKMSMRKFRKTIYARHFDRDYLANEQKKKTIETAIALALVKTDFELAKVLSEELKQLIKSL